MLCLVNITEDCGTDMTRTEIEAIVVDELEFLLRWENNLDESSQDVELINAVIRVLKEFKPPNKEDKK